MDEQRQEMVYQIKKNYGLNSPSVLATMLQVPREEFVPKKFRHMAYYDGPVSIGFGQTMSQPYTVAFMTHLITSSLSPSLRNKILEIGTGSGYQAAVLSKLFKEVYTIEIVPELARRARGVLKKLKYGNVYVKEGSGEWGWKEKSPFDAIIITAALEKKVPEELVEQLKTGGVIVAPIGPRHLQTMTRFTKMKSGMLRKEEFGKYVFVPFVKEKD